MIQKRDISSLLICNKENHVLEDLLVAEDIKKVGIYLPLQNKICKWNLECFHNNYNEDEIEILDRSFIKIIDMILKDLEEDD